MGSVSVTLFVRSSNPHTDFFVRLCDAAPGNKQSINVCEGIVRLTPESTEADENGVRRITISLTSTAHCFLPGHSIRLQVSSGALPLYARNLGTGEALLNSVAMQTADQEVFHDAMHPSCLTLPVIEQ